MDILPLVLGQLMALLISLSSYCCSQLAVVYSFNSPATQTIPVYLCLSLCLIKVKRLHHKWSSYLLLAICDVEATYLIVTALGLTSITSAQVLNSATVPFVVLLGWLFFHRLPSAGQSFGVLISVSGLACLIYADAHARGVDRENNWVGNLLSLGAAFLYACCNCLEEKLLSDKKSSSYEMLGMLGLWGTIISSCQASVFERPWQLQITSGVLAYWGGYAACMMAFYFLLCYFMSRWDASLFNLSVLTASVYAALIDWGSFRLGYWLYGLGFTLTLTGCVIYHSLGTSLAAIKLPK